MSLLGIPYGLTRQRSLLIAGYFRFQIPDFVNDIDPVLENLEFYKYRLEKFLMVLRVRMKGLVLQIFSDLLPLLKNPLRRFVKISRNELLPNVINRLFGGVNTIRFVKAIIAQVI